MKIKTLLTSLLIVFSLSGCNIFSVKKDAKATDKKVKDIVLIFNHNPGYKMFTFPSGVRSGSFPPSLISYVNNNGILWGYNPQKEVDTFTIKNIQADYLEVLYKFQGIEDIYYFFKVGDTIAFTCGKNLYPHIKSYTSEKLSKQYNFQANIKGRQVEFGFESFTLLTLHSTRVLNKVKVEQPNIYKKVFKKRNVDFVSVDTLRKQFKTYVHNYQNRLDSLHRKNELSETYYKYYDYLLRRKKTIAAIYDYRYAKKSNQTQFNVLYQRLFNDSLIHYISYDRLVNGYIWDILQKDKNVKVYRGSDKIYSDSRQIFDNINTLKNIPPKTKNLLRYYCLRDIIENFSVDDIHKYLSKYMQLSHDSIKADFLIKKYNLDFKTSNDLLLKNELGTQITFNRLLQKYKGKVLYVDFWASWCAPCLRSMPYAKKLREAYKNKNIVFVYLAKDDQEDAWKKAIKRAQTNYLGKNYFIVNSKVTKTLEKWQVYTIPHYMIFDKKGHLVYKNAPGPGSNEIRKLLNKYLKE